MKKKYLLFFLLPLALVLCGFGGQCIADYLRISFYLDFSASGQPAVSNAGQIRIYADSTSVTPLVSTNGAAYVPLIAQPKQNYIINGDSLIAQRGLGTFTTGNDAYGYDHWKMASGNGTGIFIINSVTRDLRIKSKALTTNVATITVDGSLSGQTTSHYTVACNPADAIFDGTISPNASGVAQNAITYAVTHANVGSTASGGVVTEQGLLGNAYGTYKALASGKVMVYQVIEAAQMSNLRGKTVTVQYKQKASSAVGNMKSSLIQWGSSAAAVSQETNNWPVQLVSAYNANGTNPSLQATGANNFLYVGANSLLSGGGGSISSGQYLLATGPDWVQCAYTITIPTDYNQVALAFWTDSSISNGDWFALTEIGIYDAQEIQPYAPRTYQQELALCQRYCFAINTGSANNTVISLIRTDSSTHGGQCVIQFPVDMRTIPSLTATAADWNMDDSQTAGTCNAISTVPSNTSNQSAWLSLVSTQTYVSFRVGALYGSGTNKVMIFSADY